MIGADSPHYDEMPFEVILEEDRVFVRLFSFRRPMRLTPAEGLALVAAADALVDREDRTDGPGPLERALQKLADLLGIEPGQAVDVELDPDGGEVGPGCCARPSPTTGRSRSSTGPTGATRWPAAWSTPGPSSPTGPSGTWRPGPTSPAPAATSASTACRTWCSRTRARTQAAPTSVDLDARTDDGAPHVVLDLPPWARWVAEAHPVISAEPVGDDRLRVTLAVAGSSWLERLLRPPRPRGHGRRDRRRAGRPRHRRPGRPPGAGPIRTRGRSREGGALGSLAVSTDPPDGPLDRVRRGGRRRGRSPPGTRVRRSDRTPPSAEPHPSRPTRSIADIFSDPDEELPGQAPAAQVEHPQHGRVGRWSSAGRSSSPSSCAPSCSRPSGSRRRPCRPPW